MKSLIVLMLSVVFLTGCKLDTIDGLVIDKNSSELQDYGTYKITVVETNTYRISRGNYENAAVGKHVYIENNPY